MVVWSLKSLLQGSIDEEFAKLEKKVAKLERWKVQLPKLSRAQFSVLLKEFEQFQVHSSRVFAFVQLSFSEKTDDPKRLALVSRADQLSARWSNRLRFFSQWWKRLPAKRAAHLGANREDVSYYLECLRKFRPHTLSDAEERVVAMKDTTGVSSLVTVYDTMTNGFSYEMKVKGRKRRCTREELSQFVYAKDARVRRETYELLLGKYEENRAVLAELFRALVMDWHNENIVMRKHKSPIDVRNLYNDVPSEAVDALLESCAKNVDVFQEYFRKKASLMGMKKLTRYDLYASVHAREPKMSFADARKMVLDVFGKYSKNMQACAREVFDAGHVHSEVGKGKRGGAFCLSAAPPTLPYVLLTFTGQMQEVSTLAHEMGHAVHAVLARERSGFTYHAPLPLAETASIFSETLLMRELLVTAKGARRKALLVQQLDHLYASTIRQAFFVRFERTAHEQVPKGATTDDLDTLYMANLKEQFGSAVSVPTVFKNEWLYIPHIFESPFYCYAYAFGNLLSLALVSMLDREGISAMARIERVFAWGGGKSPAHILEELGVDVCSVEFWDSGFDVIRGLVREL